jgi:hypothetical protein
MLPALGRKEESPAPGTVRLAPKSRDIEPDPELGLPCPFSSIVLTCLDPIACCEGALRIRMLDRRHGASESSAEFWVEARGRVILGGEREEDEGSSTRTSGNGSGGSDMFGRYVG